MLYENSKIKEKLIKIRSELAESFPFIHRVAIAIYNKDRDILQTYTYDEDISTDIHNYEAVFSQCTSLVSLAEKVSERVINDMSVFDESKHKHTAIIKKAGYNASFTMPLVIQGELLGFFFANSRDKNVLHSEAVERLKLVSMVIALLVYQDFSKLDVLKSTVESMTVVSKHRDPETGSHLLRMASYSLLIARELADTYKMTDIQLGYIYLYSSLHDIGKITIPDKILLKPGPLTNDEFEIMKKHTTNGKELSDNLISVYHLSDMPFISMLSNIINFHHEKLDGSGYPLGLKGKDIPIEARIIAVADIFDALTSDRPYKKAWTDEAAFTELKLLSNIKLDGECVDALFRNKEQVCHIQKLFVDDVEY